MTKTRNLSDLLDSNGDVKSTALDNVPASNDASALTTGTLDNARLSAVPNSALANSSITINGTATALGGSATINTDLVNDTTPQLGGALDVNGHSISFGDNEKARFGNADDMEIYHDGSNSWVKDNGTGVLALASNGNGIGLYNADGTKPMVFGTINSHTKLYHDGSEKLSTTSTGATVTGTLTATSFSGSGASLTGIANTASVWVNFNGTGTPAIRDDFNVSSITDNGTGDFTINFSSSLANTNYCALFTAAAENHYGLGYGSNGSPGSPTTVLSTGSFRTGKITSTGGVLTDPAQTNIAIFGG